MFTGCPVCEGLVILDRPCPNCGALMEDQGGIADCSDPYGPYTDGEKEATSGCYTGDGQCIHYLQCPHCDEVLTEAVNPETI